MRADAEKVLADAGAEIADLREELEATRHDRDTADLVARTAENAAAEVSERLEKAEARHRDECADYDKKISDTAAEHAATVLQWQKRLDEMQAEHDRQVATLEDRVAEGDRQISDRDRQNSELRIYLDEARTENEKVRTDADRQNAAAAATIERLDADLIAARTAAADERGRANRLRDDLSDARADTSAARAEVASARDRAEELREELRELRRGTVAEAGGVKLADPCAVAYTLWSASGQTASSAIRFVSSPPWPGLGMIEREYVVKLDGSVGGAITNCAIAFAIGGSAPKAIF